MDRVGYEEVHRRAEIEREFPRRADQSIEIVGHVERMDEYHMARRVLMEASGGRVRSRPRLG